MTLYACIASLLLGIPAAAQTGVPLGALGDRRPPAEHVLLLQDLNGRVIRLKIGTGLRLDFPAGVPTLSSQASGSIQVVEQVPARQADGSYLLSSPAPGATISGVKVYRNGVRQKKTAAASAPDYSMDASNPLRIVPNPAYPWSSDDDIVVDFAVN